MPSFLSLGGFSAFFPTTFRLYDTYVILSWGRGGEFLMVAKYLYLVIVHCCTLVVPLYSSAGCPLQCHLNRMTYTGIVSSISMWSSAGCCYSAGARHYCRGTPAAVAVLDVVSNVAIRGR